MPSVLFEEVEREGEEVSVTSKVEMVSPRTAKNWLESQGYNRALSKDRVTRYASAIKRQEWRSNGESIKFDANGQLMDGQHRLAAIVEANCPVPLLVVRGIDRAAFSTIDNGQKRSLAQVLKMRGELYSTNLAALVNQMFMYAEGRDFRSRTHYMPTFEQAVQFLDANPELRESVQAGTLIAQKVGCSPLAMGVCHFLFTGLDYEDSVDFFEKLKFGESLEQGSPILALRNRLTREGRGFRGLAMAEQVALTIKAWNLYRSGGTARLISWRAGGASPESFPEPI